MALEQIEKRKPLCAVVFFGCPVSRRMGGPVRKATSGSQCRLQ
jgi:hypothetical protein